MGRIHILTDSLVSLISAGEVIENPASIVKELIENSLDAGATSIEISITEGGIESINVSDNGSGIFRDDCKICLQRYSTSDSRQLTNPNLQPEKVKNIELSAYWKINDNLNFNIAGYSAYYSNAIKSVTVTMDNGTQTEQFQAVGNQDISGLQAELNFKYGNYKFYANYTYTLPVDKETDLMISDIAAHKANFTPNAKFYIYFNLNLRANYVGLRESGENTSGSQNPITEFDPVVILNSTLYVSNFIKNLSVSLSVNNLLDEEYFVPGVRNADGVRYASRFPQFGRTFSLSVIYKM